MSFAEIVSMLVTTGAGLAIWNAGRLASRLEEGLKNLEERLDALDEDGGVLSKLKVLELRITHLEQSKEHSK